MEPVAARPQSVFSVTILSAVTRVLTGVWRTPILAPVVSFGVGPLDFAAATGARLAALRGFAAGASTGASLRGRSPSRARYRPCQQRSGGSTSRTRVRAE